MPLDGSIPKPGITASAEIKTPNGRMIGVVGIDYHLYVLQEKLLLSISNEPGVTVFVMDNSSQLVLTSNFTLNIMSSENQTVRSLASECDDAVIRAGGRYLQYDNPYAKWATSADGTSLIYTMNVSTDRYWIQSQPYSDGLGIAWYLVTMQKISCAHGYFAGDCQGETSCSCEDCQLTYGQDSDSPGGSVSTCEWCVHGYFYSQTDQTCKSCPKGAECDGKAALPFPKKGYWMDTTEAEYLEDDAYCCSKNYRNGECVGTANCLGGEDYFEMCFESPSLLSGCRPASFCKRGSGGKLCDVCDRDYYYSNGNCKKCEGSVTGMVVLVCVVGIVVIILLGAASIRTIREYVNENFTLLIAMIFNTGRFKIVLVTLQIVGSISTSTGIIWPEPFASVALAYTAVSELNIFNTLPISCASPGKFHLSKVWVFFTWQSQFCCVRCLFLRPTTGDYFVAHDSLGPPGSPMLSWLAQELEQLRQ